MTKERRLAIEMWERIVEALENGETDLIYGKPVADAIKEEFCRNFNLEWKHECWFCQYIRHDWRDMPSRKDISTEVQGCQQCPLYKEHKDILRYDECGCTERQETLWTRVRRYGDVDAAKRILALLRGNK